MNKNTFSLLSSNWMFTDNSKTVLYPFLFSLIKGNTYFNKETLNTTTLSYLNASGNKSDSNNFNSNEKSVVLLNVHHPIFKYDQTCGPKGTQTIIQMMEAWKNENSIAGVLFDVNSGGGQASGNSEFAEYLNTYPKPTGVYTNDTIGSAAYYFSAGSKFIVANKHADFIGCIGTMYSKLNVEGILLKKGATLQEFYSDLSPEKNLQSRELKKGNEKPLIEKFLNPHASKFHSDLKKYRPQISEKALKGDVFSPEEALENGLIDEIGTLQTAIDKVFALAKATSNSNINSNNMSKEIKAPSIQNALGYETPFQSNENGVFLQEAELDTLETALTTANTNVTNITAEKETAETSVSDANKSIDAALETAEIDFTPEMSLSEKINLLEAQRKEFAGKAGGGKTVVVNDGDEDPAGNQQQKVYAHNEEANELLNQ
jgi:protease-4